MEILIMVICLLAALELLTVMAMVGVIFWKTCFSPSAKKAEAVQEALTEAQEQYLREQETYMQGFQNQMNYDGSPRRKDER